MATKRRKMTAEELDALHDSGAKMTAHLDTSTSRRPEKLASQAAEPATLKARKPHGFRYG